MVSAPILVLFISTSYDIIIAAAVILMLYDMFPTHLDSIFGSDLTELVKTEGTTVPRFLTKCMEEIETRGKC